MSEQNANWAGNRVPPTPVGDPSTKRFWDACAEGKLLIGRGADGKHFYPPRPISPFTDADGVDWVEAKGTGTIYSFSVMRAKVPYAIAYVELDEGPRMMTNIVDCEFSAIKVGARVQLKFVPTAEGGAPVPMFALA